MSNYNPCLNGRGVSNRHYLNVKISSSVMTQWWAESDENEEEVVGVVISDVWLGLFSQEGDTVVAIIRWRTSRILSWSRFFEGKTSWCFAWNVHVTSATQSLYIKLYELIGLEYIMMKIIIIIIKLLILIIISCHLLPGSQQLLRFFAVKAFELCFILMDLEFPN